ncbi:hypothetical protein F5880DRAFT_1201624 [Lentinula raphanica]|nr:hypothetical protein F5880DRAFT_1201624 [Lentinula raphanica]
MPREPSTKKRTAKSGECSECGIVLAYKHDLPRHMKIHGLGNVTMHKCSWAGCSFETRQKSNLTTHYRTHSKDKSQACPDCDFKACDPSSLTRHRKSMHDYVPTPRRARATRSTGMRCSPPVGISAPTKFVMDSSSASTSSASLPSVPDTRVSTHSDGGPDVLPIQHETDWHRKNAGFMEDIMRLSPPRPLLPAVDSALETSVTSSGSDSASKLSTSYRPVDGQSQDDQVANTSNGHWPQFYTPSQHGYYTQATPVVSSCGLFYEPMTNVSTLPSTSSTAPRWEESFQFNNDQSFLQSAGSHSQAGYESPWY